MNTRRELIGLLFCLVAPTLTMAQMEPLSITVYEDDFALLKHRRGYDLSAGENSIRLQQLSDQLQVDTVLVRHGANPANLNVSELIYRHQPLTPQSLLRAHVGKRVGLLRTHPLSDTDSRSEAVLLSVDGGPVLRVNGQIETAAPGRIVFNDIPEQLTTAPELEVRLVSQESGHQPVEISYLSTGFGWSTDYVAEIDADGNYLSLDAWAAVRNATNARFQAASVQLVSGTLNRVQPQQRRAPMLETARMAAADSFAATPARENLGDYHLYRLPRAVDLGAGETRRIAMLSARQVPVDTLYQVEARAPHLYQSRYAAPEQSLPVRRRVRLHNRVTHNLGQPLPAGVVRLYQRDRSGAQQLVGEDRVEHTPIDQTIQLTLGNAFDLSAEKIQLSFQKLAADGIFRNVYGSEFRIRLANASAQAVNVEVIENLPGDWRIETENLPHQRRNAAEASWNVSVPAAGETELRYRALVRF